MFNDRFGLTDLVLKGRKAQTRRIIKPQPRYDENGGMVFKTFLRKARKCVEWMCGRGCYGDNPRASYKNAIHRSPIKVGEIIAVAQSYYSAKVFGNPNDKSEPLFVPKTFDEDDAGYFNKMFVKSELMPHRIKIMGVRIERLQDISDEDCLAEGIEKEERTDGGHNYTFFDAKRERYIIERTPRDAYARLIDNISGQGTWGSNPYVWVYNFELIK